MDDTAFVAKVLLLTGGHAREARRAAIAALAELASGLESPLRRALVDHLPRPLTHAIDMDGEVRERDVDGLYLAVRRRLRLPLGKAVESTQAVLEVLARSLGEELLERTQKAVHPSVAAWLVAQEKGGEPPPYVRIHPDISGERSRTLSTGRPLTSTPLSEARPEPAQRHSVAATSVPHADTKLSTARGAAQERSDRTLASGRSR